MDMVEDQRMFERFFARFPVKFKHARTDFGEDVFLRDASAQGIKLTSKERLFIHDSISVLVKLPDGFAPMELNGRVVWSRPKDPTMWDIGVEFHKVRLMGMERMFKLVMATA
ncbi:MAG: PilZ domain-containing protein [Candidatus Omnitrophica bacterium]|nr:PilZ domain-containing protein [Candidatus Omnitrophota bacterium]